MLLGTLGASVLGNLLTGQGAIREETKSKSQGRRIYRAGKGKGINRAGEGALATTQGRGIIRAGYGNNKMDF